MSFILYRDYIRFTQLQYLGGYIWQVKGCSNIDAATSNEMTYRLQAVSATNTMNLNRLGKKHHVMFVGNMKCIDWEKS